VTPASSVRTPAAVDPLASRIPITVINGFLGSGKTTLLRRLLRHTGMNRAAVIINEFGDVGIDHELVAASSEQMTLLSNGCLCCTLRTDLQETLLELFVKRRAGEVIDFDRVFIETSGLADPIPVLHTLQTDGLLGAQYRLNGVVTLVDAVNGELDPALLADIGPQRVTARSDELSRWLNATAPESRRTEEVGQLRRRIAPGAGAHDAAIHSFCLWFDMPFTWEELNAALQALTSLRGPDLLRVKGIVHVAGERGPVVLQGAQHVFHPPVTLEHGQDTDPRSRIVFIVRNIPRESIEALFAAVGALGR